MPVDNNVMGCQVCETKFTLITRRHWCRACLKTICSKCSSAFNQNAGLLAKLSRRHENNLCTLCQEATRFAIEERMLSDAFKRHTERVPSNSGNGSIRNNGRQLFKDGAGAVDGPRRVASATPKQRSTSATLVRPQQQRRATVSPMVMDYGFAGDNVTTTPPPGGFSAARRRIPSASAAATGATPIKRSSKSAMTPKRRMSVSFADTLSSFVEPDFSPFHEGSPKNEESHAEQEERRFKQDPCAVHVDPAMAIEVNPKVAVAVSTEAATTHRPTIVASGQIEISSPPPVAVAASQDEGQENCSPKRIVRRNSSSASSDVKPILKSRTSNQQQQRQVAVRNM